MLIFLIILGWALSGLVPGYLCWYGAFKERLPVWFAILTALFGPLAFFGHIAGYLSFRRRTF